MSHCDAFRYLSHLWGSLSLPCVPQRHQDQDSTHQTVTQDQCLGYRAEKETYHLNVPVFVAELLDVNTVRILPCTTGYLRS